MKMQPLILQQVSAHFDEESNIAFIRYSGILGADESNAAYRWLAVLLEAVGVENVYGEIFDFTAVKQFQPENLVDAKKNSRKLNLRVNIHETPVAMVVRDAVQEEILRGPMRNVPENKRKRIVYSEEEALAFFKEWHADLTTP